MLNTETGEMNGAALYSAQRPRWRRTLTAILAVLAVLVGLLAMHSLAVTSEAEAAESQSSTLVGATTLMAGTTQAAVEWEATPLSQACFEGFCQLDCLMFGLLCTLGLLAVVMAWLLFRGDPPRGIFARLTPIVTVTAQRLAELRPPSLVALSISRT